MSTIELIIGFAWREGNDIVDIVTTTYDDDVA